jgi:hypothetical protein
MSQLARLQANPHREFFLQNEIEATTLLAELLLLDKFMKNPGLTKEWCSLLLFSDHETHFVCGVKIEGFANAIDNGHVVHCFPRSTYTARSVERKVAKLYGPVIGNSEISQMWLPSPRSYN